MPSTKRRAVPGRVALGLGLVAYVLASACTQPSVEDVAGTWRVRQTVASSTCPQLAAGQSLSREAFVVRTSADAVTVRIGKYEHTGKLLQGEVRLEGTHGDTKRRTQAQLSLQFSESNLLGTARYRSADCSYTTELLGERVSREAIAVTDAPRLSLHLPELPDDWVNVDDGERFVGVFQVLETVDGSGCRESLFQNRYTLQISEAARTKDGWSLRVRASEPAHGFGNVRYDVVHARLERGRLTWSAHYPNGSDSVSADVSMGLRADGTLAGTARWSYRFRGDQEPPCSGPAVLLGTPAEGIPKRAPRRTIVPVIAGKSARSP